MTMYNDLEFTFEAVSPSGIVSYQNGHATAQRKFHVLCEYAEELALRLLGKYYKEPFESVEGYEVPVLPAPFPYNYYAMSHYGRIRLVATGYSINTASLPACCFSANQIDDEAEIPESKALTDPVSFAEMEAYWNRARQLYEKNDVCICELIVNYEESDCDCLYWDWDNEVWGQNEYVLPGTCLSVERNPAYEMFTLPNTNLVWKTILDPNGNQVRLKQDSYAFKIIPKADIIVHWHNVPVSRLCQIESHLTRFRGCVNEDEWGEAIDCSYLSAEDPENPSPPGRLECFLHEPETILFVDWQEDRSKRTVAFAGTNPQTNMNTTTLKLFFKQKRIELTFGPSGSNASVSDDDAGIAGWNHLFNDSTLSRGEWRRVVIENTDQPIFKLMTFDDIFYPGPF